MDRTERPSNQRLALLREQGLLPQSPLASACIALAIILVLFNVLFERWQRLAIGWKSLLVVAGNGEEEALSSVIKDLTLVDMLRDLIFWPVGCAAIGLLLWGVARSKFLFRPQALTPNLNRLFRKSRKDFLRWLIAIVWCCCGFLLPALCIWLSLPVAFQLLNRDAAIAHGLLGAFIKGGATIVAPVLVAVAVVAYTLARFEFLQRHRMSRREVEAELRDEL